MAEIIEFAEQQLRIYVREHFGATDPAARLSGLESYGLKRLFRYSPANDLVYIQPAVLEQFEGSESDDVRERLTSLLTVLQTAPEEIKDLLDRDPGHARPAL